HVLERPRHRREEILDRFPPCVDVGRSLGARLLHLRRGQRQELLVVVLERFGAERAERVAQLVFGGLVRFQSFGVRGAVFVELSLKARLRGTAGEPANECANGEAGDQDQDDGQIQRHWQYRTLVYLDTTNGIHDSGSCSSAACTAWKMARSR